MLTLTRDQIKWLNWLKARGGRGFIDQYGRMCAQGESAPGGAFVCWLKLIAHGLIVGSDGILTVVEA